MQLIKHFKKSLISNKSLLFNKKAIKTALLIDRQKDLLNINRKNKINSITSKIVYDVKASVRRKSHLLMNKRLFN